MTRSPPQTTGHAKGQNHGDGPSDAPGFGEDFIRFLEPEVDRLAGLMAMLELRGIQGKVLSMAGRRHILVKTRGSSAHTLLVAHYDRVAGSPGALDNSAACLVLADVARELLTADPSFGQGVFFLFTDGEEAPATEGPLAQGAYPLGRGLRRVLGASIPAIIVLDVVGRGSRLLFSSAPSDMLERVGEGGGRLDGQLRDIEVGLRKAAREGKFPSPRRLPLPWSDDLGFVLAGLPAMEVSLLPEPEAERYRKDGFWPETWALLHGPGDSIGHIEPEAIASMTRFCLAYCRRAIPLR